jgi:hypothetical protein
MAVELMWSSIQRQTREKSRVQLLLRAKGDPDRLAEALWRAGEEVLVAASRTPSVAVATRSRPGPC